MRALTLFLVVFSINASAFIPPLNGLLKEVFDGRKSSGPFEVTLRHRIEGGGAVQVVEERILADKGRDYFLWTGAPLGKPLAGWLEKRNYRVGDKTFPAGSVLFVRYFTGAGGEEMRDALAAEGFIRRDQLLQFQPGAQLEGDPSQWNLREKYMRHGDIYLHRLGANAAIAVAGVDEAARKRIVYFDQKLRGLRRLEWKDGENNGAWSFEGFSGSGQNILPHRMTLEFNGQPLVTTDLVSAKAVNGKQASDFMSGWRAAKDTSPGGAEPILKTVLSYR